MKVPYKEISLLNGLPVKIGCNECTNSISLLNIIQTKGMVYLMLGDIGNEYGSVSMKIKCFELVLLI